MVRMAKVEHYEGPGFTVACGRESATAVTSDKDKVTCKGCQRTKVFRELDATDVKVLVSAIQAIRAESVRLVTVAPANTPCGWTAYGETGTKLTCESGKDAAHVLTETLPVAVKGTALCGFHSPYDVTDADRKAMADEKAWLTESEASWQAATSPTVDTDPDKCPKHGGYNIPGEAECAGCTWGDLVTRYQGTVEGKRAIGVAHSYAGRTYREGTAEYFYAAIDSITMAMSYSAEANNACRSTNHIYCVGPCPIRTRNEANASAARTTVETEAECAARIKREDFRVGDPYTFRNLVGYRLYQDRPFACRGVKCQCGKACHGTTVESVEILIDVAHYVSGGLEIQGSKGSRAVIRADRLD